MAILPTEAFDVEIEEKKEYPPIPTGDYSVVIKEAELKDTNNGGTRVAVRYEIEAGALAGRLVFDSLNIINTGDNAKITEQIARRSLIQIFEAIGKPGAQDTDDMIGGRLKVRVKVKDHPKYPNDVTKYMPLNNAPARQSFTPPAAPQPEPAAAPDVDPLEVAAAQPSAPWSRAA
jgi:hypothetical protein